GAVSFPTRAEAPRARHRPGAPAAWTVRDGQVAGAARRPGPGHGGRRLPLRGARTRRAADDVDARGATGPPGHRGDGRHPLRDAVEPLRHAVARRLVPDPRGHRPAPARGALRHRPGRAGVHRQPAAREPLRRRRADRLGGRRRRTDARARLSRPPGGAQALLLEERQVARGDRADGRRPPGLLGGLRLPQRGRPVPRGALRLL
ncbi:MAG: hypothetical protein AVDCRST_MAG79-616, partial [uncultured Thermoleophilia bacterium]